MKQHTIELNNKEFAFRFKSGQVAEFETRTKVKFLDYIQDYSINSVINILKLALKGAGQDFSRDEVEDFYDELIDNEWSLERIVMDIIYETAVISGFLKKTDLETMKEAKIQAEENKKEKILELAN